MQTISIRCVHRRNDQSATGLAISSPASDNQPRMHNETHRHGRLPAISDCRRHGAVCQMYGDVWSAIVASLATYASANIGAQPWLHVYVYFETNNEIVSITHIHRYDSRTVALRTFVPTTFSAECTPPLTLALGRVSVHCVYNVISRRFCFVVIHSILDRSKWAAPILPTTHCNNSNFGPLTPRSDTLTTRTLRHH